MCCFTNNSGMLSCNQPHRQADCVIEAVSHLAVANRGVAAGIGSQDTAQSRAAGAVHDRVAWESAVQVFLYLQVPVSAGGMPTCPHLAAQLTGGPLCRPACQQCDVRTVQQALAG